MILRRSRPLDPCLVLGSALALALPLGASAVALAQTAEPQPAAGAPAPPNAAPAAELLKQRGQELDATRAKQRAAADNEVKLKLEIEALGRDRRALEQQLITSAAQVRGVEAKIDDVRTRLDSLDEHESILKKSLDERRNVIIEILAALQRVGRQPPPALLVRPDDALKALRTAIALGAVVPSMRADAEALAGDLADLTAVRQEIVAKRKELSQNLDQLARDQLRLNMLIDERQKKQASAEQALQAEQQRALELAQQASGLQDLISKLEESLGNRNARIVHGSGQSGRAALAALSDPGRLTPAVAFAETRGHLRLPVNGVTISGFGDPNGVGGTQKGLSIAAHAGAEIISPCDGWVVYAGPFRSYGQLLILNAGGGYHVLLAGMERISVDLGQFVLTGEPVAVMGKGAQPTVAAGAKSKRPVLYVEFRKNGTPIDPSPWWATNESEKVRG